MHNLSLKSVSILQLVYKVLSTKCLGMGIGKQCISTPLKHPRPSSKLIPGHHAHVLQGFPEIDTVITCVTGRSDQPSSASDHIVDVTWPGEAVELGGRHARVGAHVRVEEPVAGLKPGLQAELLEWHSHLAFIQIRFIVSRLASTWSRESQVGPQTTERNFLVSPFRG
jgi:hypothetical protein